MSEVSLMEGETFESMLRRFNKKVQAARILPEIKRREHYEPPSVQRKKKAAVKRRKSYRSRGPR